MARLKRAPSGARFLLHGRRRRLLYSCPVPAFSSWFVQISEDAYPPFAFPAPDLQHAMQMALEYRKGGRSAEAAALYRQLLSRYPQQPLLLGQLGELLMS